MRFCIRPRSLQIDSDPIDLFAEVLTNTMNLFIQGVDLEIDQIKTFI